MKNKNKYSLTSKERKDLRDAEIKKADKNKPIVNEDGAPVLQTLNKDGVEVVTEIAPKVTLTRKNILIISLAIFMAVMLLVFAILIPTVIHPAVVYSKTDNPVAVIHLDNGMKLEFEILEDKCPIAATNFLYLVKKKFFNNTILFDVQNNFMRFGNYLDANDYGVMRQKDITFLNTLTDITVPRVGTGINDKLSYRLKKDTEVEANQSTSMGYLSSITSKGSTYFQICETNGARENVNNDNLVNDNLTSVSFGRYYSEDTRKDIEKLYEKVSDTVSISKNPINPGNYWMKPKNTVKIKKISLYNMDNSKWRNFNFDEYFQPQGKEHKISYWG